MAAIVERPEKRSAIGSPAWKALKSHYQQVRKLHLRKLFADDPSRGERLTTSAVGIELDYSKNRITEQTLQLFVSARQRRGPRAADRGDVFRKQDKHYRKPCSPAHCVARPGRSLDHG